jgi:hypothetical protein
MKSGPITGAQTRQQMVIILRQRVDVNQRRWHQPELDRSLMVGIDQVSDLTPAEASGSNESCCRAFDWQALRKNTHDSG